ncbi:MAG: anti-sigma factor [Acidobacteria bacterium]|nr:anti-sigma factor [Acidobacteriota bacterium]
MTHLDAQDALPLYVLNVLDPVERETLELHLRDCVECQAHLAADRQTADVLGRVVAQVRPRAELKTRVMRVTGTAASVSVPTSEAQSGTSAVGPLPRRPAMPATWLALAATSLIAIGSSIGLMRARNEVAELRSDLATWQARVADAEGRAARATTEITTQRQAIALLTSSDLVQATLSGVPPTGAARARAFVSRAQNTIIMSAQDLPAPPPGQAYQLWVVAGGQAISAGTFTTDADGRGQIIGSIPALPAAPGAIAVTLEREGGVPQPTGPKVLVGTPVN